MGETVLPHVSLNKVDMHKTTYTIQQHDALAPNNTLTPKPMIDIKELTFLAGLEIAFRSCILGK